MKLFFQKLVTKIKKIFIIDDVECKQELKEKEFQQLKNKIYSDQNVVDLQTSGKLIFLFIKKYELTEKSEEFKTLKSYIKIQKLLILCRRLKNS
jgi:hypothetical protein